MVINSLKKLTTGASFVAVGLVALFYSAPALSGMQDNAASRQEDEPIDFIDSNKIYVWFAVASSAVFTLGIALIAMAGAERLFR